MYRVCTPSFPAQHGNVAVSFAQRPPPCLRTWGMLLAADDRAVWPERSWGHRKDNYKLVLQIKSSWLIHCVAREEKSVFPGFPGSSWKGRWCTWVLQEGLGSPTCLSSHCSYLGSWLDLAARLWGVSYLHGVTSVSAAMAGTRWGLRHLSHISAESNGGAHANQQKSLLDCCLFLLIKEKTRLVYD